MNQMSFVGCALPALPMVQLKRCPRPQPGLTDTKRWK